MRNRFITRVIIAAIATCIATAVALVTAQTPGYRAPRTADGKPNLNGIWQAINTANYDIEAHSAAPSPVLELGAAGAVPAGLGVVEGGTLPYTPEALKKRDENRANRLKLDPEVKDAWGLPAIRVTHREHADDFANARFLQDRGMEILEAAGALRATRAPIVPQTISAHLLGTCRMGNDPATSVVDKYHRSHDVPHLFVCDGSSLVTSGRGQPTMTIQALAFRAGEHLARFAKRGEI